MGLGRAGATTRAGRKLRLRAKRLRIEDRVWIHQLRWCKHEPAPSHIPARSHYAQRASVLGVAEVGECSGHVSGIDTDSRNLDTDFLSKLGIQLRALRSTPPRDCATSDFYP